MGIAFCGVLTPAVLHRKGRTRPLPRRPLTHRSAAGGAEERSAAPVTVEVSPVVRDDEIGERLQSVLDATGWFTGAQVRVDAGVVFLSGQTETEELRKWAGDLARNTQAVVAVANRIEVPQPALWDLQPARTGLLALWRDLVRSLPLFVKSKLHNFTSSANRREDFIVGIDYAALITDAQEVARQVLADHPAVLKDPEPAVLVDSLGSSAVNLRVYFWLNGREHSWLKVRSSVIRLTKRAFQEHGISMPDDAREVIFPQGVPVTLVDRATAARAFGHAAAPPGQRPAIPPAEGTAVVSTQAEAGLYSEAAVIEAQARRAKPLKEGANLLPSAPEPPSRLL